MKKVIYSDTQKEGKVSKKAKVLVVDDDSRLRNVVKTRLEASGYSVLEAADGEAALKIIKHQSPDLVLLDIILPKIDGVEVLENVMRMERRPVVIMMTAVTEMGTIIKMIQKGAYDYIVKPFEGAVIEETVKKALKVVSPARRTLSLKVPVREVRPLDMVMVAKAPVMQEIFKEIGRIAEKKVTVLIRGESGTGKELVARTIHVNSARKGPFVAVDCASLPKTLLESELFGHEKGSFTDATASRAGKIEQAQNGTLFLDEIGNLSTHTQAKLLRVLQEEEIQRIGGEGSIKVDTRFISATNSDLEELVREGAFREDLYHRLNVFTINLPPLRERKEDIPLLVDHFLKKCAAKFGELPKRFDQKAMEMLIRHDWPGNVRELENTVSRAVVNSKGDILLPDDLSLVEKSELSAPENEAEIAGIEGRKMPEVVEEVEKKMILRALEKTGWVQTEAAKKLGISRKILKYKIDKLGIPQKRRTGKG